MLTGLFQPALTLHGPCSGLPTVDDLLGPLPPHTLTLLTGTDAVHQLAHHYAAHTLRHHPYATLLWFDAGLRFNLYQLTDDALRHETDPDQLLPRILIARPFTPHQLAQHLLHDLPQLLHHTPHLQLILVTDYFQLFTTPDIRTRDATHILTTLNQTLHQHTQQTAAPILLTATQPIPPILLATLTPHIHATLRLHHHRLALHLHHHPHRLPHTIILAPDLLAPVAAPSPYQSSV